MKRLCWVLSYFLVAGVAILGFIIGMGGIDKPGKLEQLESIIEKYFIGEVDKTAIEDEAAFGMVDALGDQWSYYMTAQEYKSYQETMANAYVGVGIVIVQTDDGYFEIMKVEENGPAKEAGVAPGDVITAVEGQDVCKIPMETVRDMVRGDQGTKVQLTLKRGDQTLQLQVQRRQIQTVVASARMLESGLGLVTIENFDSRCAKETIAALEGLLEQGAKGIIFDVRFNPGGYQHELVQLLDYLLPEGPLFRSVDYAGNESVDSSDKNFLDIPMAVLINGGSYSAAEFFAAALQEYEAAVVVGEPTTGKGYFQSAFELSDGSAAVISVGKYLTPKGVSLADTGLTPDIALELEEQAYLDLYYDRLTPENDPQIRAAEDVLLGK